MMVIKRKTLMITSLVLLLVVVSYVNHQLNKQSLLSTSGDYEKYEADEISKLENPGDNTLMTNSENILNPNTINDISQLTENMNNSIEETISTQESVVTYNYFVEYRLSRDSLRGSLIERLDGIIDDEKTTEEVRTLAQKEILRIGDVEESELYLEGLIQGKGFEDVLVFLKEDSVRVIVDIKQLTEQDVMKILEIVRNETGIEATNIRIMKKF